MLLTWLNVWLAFMEALSFAELWVLPSPEGEREATAVASEALSEATKEKTGCSPGWVSAWAEQVERGMAME